MKNFIVFRNFTLKIGRGRNWKMEMEKERNVVY